MRPASRLLGWAVGLAIAWVAPSLVTAAAYATAAASQGTWHRSRISEIVDAGRDVFVQSLSPSTHFIWPLVLAVVIGVAGSVQSFSQASDRRA